MTHLNIISTTRCCTSDKCSTSGSTDRLVSLLLTASTTLEVSDGRRASLIAADELGHLKLPLSRSICLASARNSTSLCTKEASKKQIIDSVLFLTSSIVSASDPKRVIAGCCSHCQVRERKRYGNKRTGFDQILFYNSAPFIEFGGGDACVPLRITCYCRHHEENVGFSLVDECGVLIASGMSEACFVTDDHKKPETRKRPRTTDVAPLPSLTIPSTIMPVTLISKLVPSNGPTHGGIQVSIIGSGFTAATRICFGSAPAAVEFHSESVIVATLPPHPLPGPVIVSVNGQQGLTFFYTDTTDVSLLVGGGIPDSLYATPREIASQIIGNVERSVAWAIRDVDRKKLERVDSQGHTLLTLACCAGYSKIARLIVDKGAILSCKRAAALAVLFQRKECSSLLDRSMFKDLSHNLGVFRSLVRPSASESNANERKSWVGGRELGRGEYWARLFLALIGLAVLHYLVLLVQGVVVEWVLTPHLGGAVRVPLM